jgi:hypothetical protein
MRIDLRGYVVGEIGLRPARANEGRCDICVSQANMTKFPFRPLLSGEPKILEAKPKIPLNEPVRSVLDSTARILRNSHAKKRWPDVLPHSRARLLIPQVPADRFRRL